MMVILLYLLETNGTDPSTLHGIGLAFLVGRLMHGICFGFMPLHLFRHLVDPSHAQTGKVHNKVQLTVQA